MGGADGVVEPAWERRSGSSRRSRHGGRQPTSQPRACLEGLRIVWKARRRTRTVREPHLQRSVESVLQQSQDNSALQCGV